MRHTRSAMKFIKTHCLIALSAVVTVSAAVAANPEWDQATRLYNSGNYKEALTDFRKIADKTPSEPTVHYMLAQCYKNSGNTKQAIVELEWISKSTSNPRVKGPADALLAQIRASGGTAGTIAGAVSPYQKSSVASTSSAAQVNDWPPSKEFINDSASATVSAAARKGWTPCRNTDCLNFGANGWHHAEMPGHPATDNWMQFTREDGSHYMYTQQHIGNLIQKGVDVGPCPVCKASGWVKTR